MIAQFLIAEIEKKKFLEPRKQAYSFFFVFVLCGKKLIQLFGPYHGIIRNIRQLIIHLSSLLHKHCSVDKKEELALQLNAELTLLHANSPTLKMREKSMRTTHFSQDYFWAMWYINNVKLENICCNIYVEEFNQTSQNRSD